MLKKNGDDVDRANAGSRPIDFQVFVPLVADCVKHFVAHVWPPKALRASATIKSISLSQAVLSTVPPSLLASKQWHFVGFLAVRFSSFIRLTRRKIHSYRFPMIGLGCTILMVQFATAQESLQQSAAGASAPHLTNPKHLEIFRIGRSIAGERIASTTCDPFMTQAQEQRLMRMLLEQDDAPWLDYNLTRLRDRLSNECTVWIDEKSIENESVTVDQPLMKEVPIGVLGARLATLLGSNQLAFTIQRNRLEITSQSDRSSGIRRIYDVSPLVRTVSTGTNTQETVLAYPLVQLVESTISPDCWQSGGGSSMILEFIPPDSTDRVCLIVLCSTENHIAIQNLLDQLNTFGLTPQAQRVPTNKTLPTSQVKRLPFDRLDVSAF